MSTDGRQPLLMSVDFEDWHQLMRRRVGVSGWETPGPALGRQTEITRLPWVNRKVRKWEPEPFRWLGVHLMYNLLRVADGREDRLGIGPSKFAKFGNWLTGRH